MESKNKVNTRKHENKVMAKISGGREQTGRDIFIIRNLSGHKFIGQQENLLSNVLF